ncbi:MAG: alpha/beta hydrolase [Planctomycetes bacterium]|nr:alpha/beta hydrolase [Planctomycetota bacterium]
MHTLLRVLPMAVVTALVAPAQVTQLPDLVYATLAPQRALHLDLYLPSGATRPTPCVVWIHGGGWQTGSRMAARADALALAGLGLAVAAVEYRLSGEATWPAQIHDVKGAVRWLRANARQYGLDIDRFAAFGSSAGGHLAAVLGTSAGSAFLEGVVGGNLAQTTRIQAVADFFGPTDFFQMGGFHLLPGSPESNLIGATLGDILAHRNDPAWAPLVYLVEQANPITHVSTDDPPFWIAHGTGDTTVPYSQSTLLLDALLQAGRQATLRTTSGGHGMPQSEYDARSQWLVQQLLGRQPQRSYGIACGIPGADRPGAGWLGLAVPGQSFALTLERGLPGAPVALLLAASRSLVPLTPIGAPGCFGLVDQPLDLALSANPAGRAQVRIDVPAAMPPGFEAFSQWAILAPAVNPLGLLTTDGLVSLVR